MPLGKARIKLLLTSRRVASLHANDGIPVFEAASDRTGGATLGDVAEYVSQNIRRSRPVVHASGTMLVEDWTTYVGSSGLVVLRGDQLAIEEEAQVVSLGGTTNVQQGPGDTIVSVAAESAPGVWTVPQHAIATLVRLTADTLLLSISGASSPPVDSGDEAPAITGVPTVSGVAQVGETLTATAAPMTGSPSPSLSWRWLRGGVAIAGATGEQYTIDAADAGAQITVEQAGTSSAGTATATSTPTAVVTYPSLTISGDVTSSGTLSASGGSGSYTWTRDSDSTVLGTGSTQVLSVAEIGSTVTLSDDAGTTPVTSDVVRAVLPSYDPAVALDEFYTMAGFTEVTGKIATADGVNSARFTNATNLRPAAERVGDIVVVRCASGSFLERSVDIDLELDLLLHALIRIERDAQDVFMDIEGAVYFATQPNGGIKLDLGGVDATYNGDFHSVGDWVSCVGIIRSTGNSELWIDGVQRATGPAGSALNPGLGKLRVGALTTGTTYTATLAEWGHKNVSGYDLTALHARAAAAKAVLEAAEAAAQ